MARMRGRLNVLARGVRILVDVFLLVPKSDAIRILLVRIQRQKGVYQPVSLFLRNPRYVSANSISDCHHDLLCNWLLVDWALPARGSSRTPSTLGRYLEHA